MRSPRPPIMRPMKLRGASFDLLTPECRERVWEAPPEEFGARWTLILGGLAVVADEELRAER